MKIFIISLFISATSFAAEFSKSYSVICDLSAPPVKLSLSEGIGSESLDCRTQDKQAIFSLKNDLTVEIGSATYIAPKDSKVFLHSKNSALDKTCESILTNVKSVLFSISPKSMPSLKYNISLDADGSVFLSQMQVLMCTGKAD